MTSSTICSHHRHQNRTSDVCGSFKLLTPCTSTKQGNTYKPEYP